MKPVPKAKDVIDPAITEILENTTSEPRAHAHGQLFFAEPRPWGS